MRFLALQNCNVRKIGGLTYFLFVIRDNKKIDYFKANFVRMCCHSNELCVTKANIFYNMKKEMLKYMNISISVV
jgi:hypothetical protein